MDAASPPLTPQPRTLSDRIRARASAIAGGLPRAFWVLWAGMFVNRVGSFVVPFLAIYLTQARGLPAATAGAVVALYGAGAAVASPLGGYCADHLGRRVTMIAALALGGLGMIALGFARDLAVIAPGCFVVAVLGECYRPAMQAALSDLVPAHDRVRAFGLLYWVINLGVSFGFALAGLLATRSFLLLFLGDGITSLVFAYLVWRAVPETRPHHDAPHEAPPRAGFVRGFLAPYRDRPFLVFVLLSVLILLVFMQHVASLPVDMSAHGLSRARLGVVLAINGVLIVLVQPFLAPVVGRLDRSRVLAVGAVLVGLGFGVNGLAGGSLMFAIGMAVWTLGEILTLPIANALVADVAPHEMRGRYQGAYGLSFGIAGCAGPLAGMAVLQHLGAPALWGACLALGVLVAAGHLVLAPRLARLRERRLAVPAGDPTSPAA